MSLEKLEDILQIDHHLLLIMVEELQVQQRYVDIKDILMRNVDV